MHCLCNWITTCDCKRFSLRRFWSFFNDTGTMQWSLPQIWYCIKLRYYIMQLHVLNAGLMRQLRHMQPTPLLDLHLRSLFRYVNHQSETQKYNQYISRTCILRCTQRYLSHVSVPCDSDCAHFFTHFDIFHFNVASILTVVLHFEDMLTTFAHQLFHKRISEAETLIGDVWRWWQCVINIHLPPELAYNIFENSTFVPSFLAWSPDANPHYDTTE
jgi:hypothetical protein